jgi:hypothetical protein
VVIGWFLNVVRGRNGAGFVVLDAKKIDAWRCTTNGAMGRSGLSSVRYEFRRFQGTEPARLYRPIGSIEGVVVVQKFVGEMIKRR